MENITAVNEDTYVITLLLANINLLNGQLFQKSKTQNCQKILDIQQLRRGFPNNIVESRVTKGLRRLKSVNNFKEDFKWLGRY